MSQCGFSEFLVVIIADHNSCICAISFACLLLCSSPRLHFDVFVSCQVYVWNMSVMEFFKHNMYLNDPAFVHEHPFSFICNSFYMMLFHCACAFFFHRNFHKGHLLILVDVSWSPSKVLYIMHVYTCILSFVTHKKILK